MGHSEDEEIIDFKEIRKPEGQKRPKKEVVEEPEFDESNEYKGPTTATPKRKSNVTGGGTLGWRQWSDYTDDERRLCVRENQRRFAAKVQELVPATALPWLEER